MTRFISRSVAVLTLICASITAWQIAAAQDDNPNAGSIIFKIDQKEVEIKTTYCVLMNTDSGYADGYELIGEDINLQGYFDLNEDGKYDGEDEIQYDDDENVIAKSILDKPASVIGSEERPEAIIKLPGLGECPITGGTFTATKYKNSKDDTEDHWSGKIELGIRTPKGPMTIHGTFESDVEAVW